MFLTLVSTTTLLVLVVSSSPTARATANNGTFSIQTPVFTQCSPARLSWESTIAPYDILIANQSSPCGYAVADLGEIHNNSATWTVSLPAGWNVVVSIADAFEDEAWSQPIAVQWSSNTSCLSPELAIIAAAHPPPTTGTGTGTSPVGSKGTATLGRNGAPSARRIPACAVLLGTIAVVASAFFAF